MYNFYTGFHGSSHYTEQASSLPYNCTYTCKMTTVVSENSKNVHLQQGTCLSHSSSHLKSSLFRTFHNVKTIDTCLQIQYTFALHNSSYRWGASHDVIEPNIRKHLLKPTHTKSIEYHNNYYMRSINQRSCTHVGSMTRCYSLYGHDCYGPK